MNLESKPRGRKSDIVIQELDNEVLIYDLKLSKAFCLNETSGLVYNLCDGHNSIDEIRELLGKKLKAPIPEDLVWLALDVLRKENLLEKSEEIEINFDGLSRRQVLRKVGLASLVTLPLITSLIAPSSVNAASLLALGRNCTSPTQCSTGNCTTGTMGCCNPGVSPGATFSPICSSAALGCGPVAPSCCGTSVNIGPGSCGSGALVECVCQG